MLCVILFMEKKDLEKYLKIQKGIKILKTKLPVLSETEAENLLQEIFASCNVEENTIPFRDLLSYADYRNERFSLQKNLIQIFLLLFTALPILFIPPNFTITTLATTNGSGASYHVFDHSFLPIKSIVATMGNKSLPITQVSEDNYSISPLNSGDMNITITLINNQYLTKKITVDFHDQIAPSYVRHTIHNEVLCLTVEDNQNSIDYSAIKAFTLDKEVVYPTSFEKKTGKIYFNLSNESLNIFIPDTHGNSLHLIINPTE